MSRRPAFVFADAVNVGVRENWGQKYLAVRKLVSNFATLLSVKSRQPMAKLLKDRAMVGVRCAQKSMEKKRDKQN